MVTVVVPFDIKPVLLVFEEAHRAVMTPDGLCFLLSISTLELAWDRQVEGASQLRSARVVSERELLAKESFCRH